MFFTDEFWWVGIHRAPVYLWTAAIAAILLGTFYIPYSQSLLFPHREKRVITQNVAIANMGMVLTIFLILISLLILVVVVVIIVELWWYPPAFVEHWFQSFKSDVNWRDMLQVALGVSTLGTLTGALGSGFHGRKIIRAVSFFRKEP